MLRLTCAFAAGLCVGLGIALVSGWQPTAVTGAEIWTDWIVVRDDETMLCTSPVIFWRAKQIECP